MAVPNIFGSATSAIPLSQLDTNFATPVTIGNTAVQLGNTVTSFGNVTLTNVTISSGNVTITGANVSGTANVSTLVVTGNQSFVGTGNRITGDFSNATVASRVTFQTSTTNGNTIIGALPNGTATGSTFNAYNSSDAANNAYIQLAGLSTEARLGSTITGTGTYLPMTFHTGGSERARIDTSGNVGIGTASPSAKLQVDSSSSTFSANIRARNSNFGSGVVGAASGILTVATDMNNIAFYTGSNLGVDGTSVPTNERMRIDSSGNVGIGNTTPSSFDATGKPLVVGSGSGNQGITIYAGTTGYSTVNFADGTTGTDRYSGQVSYDHTNNALLFATTTGLERMRIDSSGNLLVGKTSISATVAGFLVESQGDTYITAEGVEGKVLYLNRLTSDGDIVQFAQANTTEGTISVSGTTVSYNGGHLSRWAQTTTAKDESLLKGTVLSNLDAMNVYTDAEGNPVDNEQLNKVKVSDVEGDANVAGVFVNWTYDEQHSVDEINMAMTGDMIIRIAQGVTVARGDLLMSAGNGTAKPQGDDIVRSKTVAKVTSTHVTCTYEDGSYCVPCVLMAC
jgi:hypothetical protein